MIMSMFAEACGEFLWTHLGSNTVANGTDALETHALEVLDSTDNNRVNLAVLPDAENVGHEEDSGTVGALTLSTAEVALNLAIDLDRLTTWCAPARQERLTAG
jgi:hypothetical protein